MQVTGYLGSVSYTRKALGVCLSLFVILFCFTIGALLALVRFVWFWGGGGFFLFLPFSFSLFFFLYILLPYPAEYGAKERGLRAAVPTPVFGRDFAWAWRWQTRDLCPPSCSGGVCVCV